MEQMNVYVLAGEVTGASVFVVEDAEGSVVVCPAARSVLCGMVSLQIPPFLGIVQESVQPLSTTAGRGATSGGIGTGRAGIAAVWAMRGEARRRIASCLCI
jgi:hypothetical protein